MDFRGRALEFPCRRISIVYVSDFTMKGLRFESVTIVRSLVHTLSTSSSATRSALSLPLSQTSQNDRSSARRKELGLTSLPSWLISHEFAYTWTNSKAAEYTTNSPLQYWSCRSAASRPNLSHFMHLCRIWLLPSAKEELQPQGCRFTSQLWGVDIANVHTCSAQYIPSFGSSIINIRLNGKSNSIVSQLSTPHGTAVAVVIECHGSELWQSFEFEL